MKLFRKSKIPEVRQAQWDEFWETVISGGRSAAGVAVSEEGSMRYSAVWAAVRVISATVASLPLVLYKRLDEAGRERAYNHPLYRILHDTPNPLFTPYRFWEFAVICLLLHGNFYAEKTYKNGQISGLYPLPPRRVAVYIDPETENIAYEFTKFNGQKVVFTRKDLLHIPGLSIDGVVGLSVISYARECIGLGVALEEFGARFISNNARPGIALKLSGRYDDLSEQALKNLRESFREKFVGLRAVGKPIFLEEGMDISTFSIAPEDAQFLESRRFQVTEIARFFGVPPHKIYDLERATYSNIEEQNMEFLTDSISPWCSRIEQEISLQLLMESERENYYAEFLREGYLRANSEGRANFYKNMFYLGALSINEIRARENLNPIEEGDNYYLPVNLAPIGEIAAVSEEPILETREAGNMGRSKARRRLKKYHQKVFAQARKRVLNSERNEWRKIIKKTKTADERIIAFKKWYFEEDGFARLFIAHIEPVVLALGLSSADLALEEVRTAKRDDLGMDYLYEIEEQLRAYVGRQQKRESRYQYNHLRKVLTENPIDTHAEVLEAEYETFGEDRCNYFSMWETTRIESLGATLAWAAIGVVSYMWIAGANACAACQALSGQVISHGESFVAKGETVEHITAEWNVRTPPLHFGCECDVEPMKGG